MLECRVALDELMRLADEKLGERAGKIIFDDICSKTVGKKKQ